MSDDFVEEELNDVPTVDFEGVLEKIHHEFSVSDDTDAAFEAASDAFKEIESKYKQLRGISATEGKFDLKKVKSLITDNWKTISAVGAGFGLPIAAADPGAFGKVFDLLTNFLPF